VLVLVLVLHLHALLVVLGMLLLLLPRVREVLVVRPVRCRLLQLIQSGGWGSGSGSRGEGRVF